MGYCKREGERVANRDWMELRVDGITTERICRVLSQSSVLPFSHDGCY